MQQQSPRFVINQRLFACQLLILGLAGAFVSFMFVFTGQLGSFPFSFLVGCLGGSIALLRRLPGAEKAALEALASSWMSTLMPVLYGGLMASVAYLLFMSGILTGDGGDGLFTSNLFPSFRQPELADDELLDMRTVLTIRPASVGDFGKLMVWCFLSGFSERLIVGFLGTLEERAGLSRDNEDET